MLKKFLGLSRWQALGAALKAQSGDTPVGPPVDSIAVLFAVILALLPVVIAGLDATIPGSSSAGPTIAFGACAVLGMVHRRNLGLNFISTKNWRSSLSLTHTAVALGCIPAVVILFLSPELLAERHELLSESLQPADESSPGARISLAHTVALVISIAVWVAVVEEVIFRGVLLSVLRRWSLIPTQRKRDLFAAIVSAALFGGAHYMTWGPLASVGLVGLGLGFVMAYIATGEQLLPVMLYHFAFDLLSISISLYL